MDAPTRFYLIKNSQGLYLSHKGAERWVSDTRKAHVFDSKKDPREVYLTQKCYGETVTTEDW